MRKNSEIIEEKSFWVFFVMQYLTNHNKLAELKLIELNSFLLHDKLLNKFKPLSNNSQYNSGSSLIESNNDLLFTNNFRLSEKIDNILNPQEGIKNEEESLFTLS